MTPRSSAATDREGALQAFRVLRAQATRYAIVGTLIAAAAVVLATLLVCLYVYDGLTVDNVIRAHRENIAIWALDAMPFLFAWWGQYASMRLARAGGSLVERRTGDLRQELDEARYTAQAKTDFFARMSHELRTPLNAIIGMSELLMETDDPERRREQAHVIHDSAHGLLTLINDVLDFSKIEAGRMELDEVAFDLHQHLNAVATLLAQQAEAKGIRLVSLVPPQAPRHVVGDPGRLRQVVINLVGNAIKFTDEGEVVLSLRDWDELAEGGHRVHIEVADTGAGIAPQDQALLFGAYRQGGPRHGRGGTGLGLSITRELVRAMEGEIDFESTPGEGSVFRFSARLGAATPPARAEAAADVELGGRRLLLVEPDETVREGLAGQLRALGLTVTAVGDGVEAMQQALRAASEAAPFDLLLTDMFAPYLSGEELGRRLKARPQTRDICLALMTTTGARGDAKRVNEAGFAAYLTRPIPPEHLGDLLRATLATRGLSEAQRRVQGLVTRYSVRARVAGGDRPLLVVDDSAVNRHIGMHHLARLGLRGEAVTTGEEALQAVSEGDYGAILLDLQLPDLSGDQVVERIRRLDGPGRRVPVLVLTAGATDAQARRCRDAGANEILIRPLDREGLREALVRHHVIPGPPESEEAGAGGGAAGEGAAGEGAAGEGAAGEGAAGEGAAGEGTGGAAGDTAAAKAGEGTPAGAGGAAGKAPGAATGTAGGAGGETAGGATGEGADGIADEAAGGATAARSTGEAGHAAAAEPEEATLDPLLARVFLREGAGRIDEMRAALDGEPDLEALARHAHALQGASRHIPGERLPEAAAGLERIAGDGDPAAAARQLDEVEAAWTELRTALERTLGLGGASHDA